MSYVVLVWFHLGALFGSSLRAEGNKFRPKGLSGDQYGGMEHFARRGVALGSPLAYLLVPFGWRFGYAY